MRLFSRRFGWLVAAHLALLLFVSLRAWAESVKPDDYHHTAWTSEDGIGAVFDIQQASDGYLWLTTSIGVFRFDGVRFESVEEATNGAVPKGEVSSFYLPKGGSVWLTTRDEGLLLWKGGRLTVFNDRRCTPAFRSGGIAEDRDGTLWVQAGSGLFRLDGAACKQVTEFPAGIMIDRSGTLWMEDPSGALLSMPRGQSSFRVSQKGEGPTLAQSFLHQAPDGSIWLSDDHGLRRVTDSKGEALSGAAKDEGYRNHARAADFTFTASGSLWVPTDEGLHLVSDVFAKSKSSADTLFTASAGLSSEIVRKVFIGREGCIWVGTNAGLDRLRRTILPKIALDGSPDDQLAIAAGDDGSVWIGSSGLPLTHVLKDGSRKSYPETGQITSIRRAHDGSIWIAGRGKADLWQYDGTRLTPRHYQDEQAMAVTSIAIDRNGDPWIATLWPETYQYVRGTWERRSRTLGKPPGFLGAMNANEEGDIWFAFPDTLVKWDGKSYQRFTAPTGFPWILVTTLCAHGEHVWMGGEGGVQFFADGAFHTMRFRDPDLPGRVSGIVETASGDLWMNGFSGVTHVKASELKRWIANPESSVVGERLNALDGLPGLSIERYPEPSLVESSDHRLWFATTKGVSWLDPAAMDRTRNSLPPPVAINAISANGRRLAVADVVTVPAHNETLEIDYTGLSLVIPERVLFRYRLDGMDKEWQEVGTRRQAYYTKLRPGLYRFHVIACNNDGVWNDIGATLAFRVLPAWYETNSFRAFCVAAVLLLAWAAHRLRLRSLAKAINVRFNERLNERTRLARELHDSLLGTIQATKWAADDSLEQSPDPVQMRGTIQQLSEWLGQAIEEGREALHALRMSTTESNDLAASLRRAFEECMPDGRMELELTVSGDSRDMHPIVRDEIFRIGHEAIRNACKHSEGRRCRIALRYAQDFTLCVRDDGKGLDPVFLTKGKKGHFGLQGMSERAHRIEGKLAFACAQGTEITLIVPGYIVFLKDRRRLHRDEPLE